eukprot:6785600-Ditylum_brightwellii.AAC.1
MNWVGIRLKPGGATTANATLVASAAAVEYRRERRMLLPRVLFSDFSGVLSLARWRRVDDGVRARPTKRDCS